MRAPWDVTHRPPSSCRVLSCWKVLDTFECVCKPQAGVWCCVCCEPYYTASSAGTKQMQIELRDAVHE